MFNLLPFIAEAAPASGRDMVFAIILFVGMLICLGAILGFLTWAEAGAPIIKATKVVLGFCGLILFVNLIFTICGHPLWRW